MVKGKVSDFGEFFVGFVDESPENLAHWDVAAVVVATATTTVLDLNLHLHLLRTHLLPTFQRRRFHFLPPQPQIDQILMSTTRHTTQSATTDDCACAYLCLVLPLALAFLNVSFTFPLFFLIFSYFMQ